MKRLDHTVKDSIKRHTEAKRVILDKIEHFKKTGNTRKLGIYDAKLGKNGKAMEHLKVLLGDKKDG